MIDNEVILEKLKGIQKLFEEKFEQNEKEHEVIFSLFDKKAGRWVEKFTVGTITTILVAVIGAVMGLILIKPTYQSALYLINLIA